ncbi:MAG: hypothetical protein EP329_04720 [Deltaproteobacteria bacterium]|nr:MAG: hypothetical protein EP329_04720 [Deltaproteobacteria bacterium]
MMPPRRDDLQATQNPALRPPPLPPEALAEAAGGDVAEAIEPHVAQMVVIARILLGAAHADGFYAAAEAVAIADILSRFVDQSPLPPPVQAAMRAFDPATFDVERACANLAVETARDRQELLDLVSRVTDADAVLHAKEGVYLRRVARAIGASDDEVAHYLAGEEPPPLPGEADRVDESHPWREG